MLHAGRKEDQKEVSHIQNILFGKDTFTEIYLVNHFLVGKSLVGESFWLGNPTKHLKSLEIQADFH